MAISKVFVDEDVWGKFRVKIWDITLDTSYPTGGYGSSLGFSAIALGVGSLIVGVQVIAWDADGPAVVLGYDRVNQKLMAFRAGASTPAGTISAPTITVTDGAVTVVGGGIGEAIGINPDSNAGALSKAAATNRTIPQATFGIAPTTATASVPTFTGTAGAQAALAQVSNAVNLSAFVARCLVIGR
jgi:hypothetical protein